MSDKTCYLHPGMGRGERGGREEKGEEEWRCNVSNLLYISR